MQKALDEELYGELAKGVGSGVGLYGDSRTMKVQNCLKPVWQYESFPPSLRSRNAGLVELHHA